MIAELSQPGAEGSMSFKELAESFGVSEAQIAEDLEAIGNATDNPQGVLGNMEFSVVKGATAVSKNAFRRPLILSRDEALALAVALGSDPDATASLARLVPHPVGVADRIGLGRKSESSIGGIHSLVLTARQLTRCLEIDYATPGKADATTRVIHPHQVVESNGVNYVVAWCEAAGAERRFRMERILEAELLDREFTLRDELREPLSEDDLDDRSDTGDRVTVKFFPSIARWIVERYPDGVTGEDGSLQVEFTVWNPQWLVEHVLQYGAEAEVISPPIYRGMMMRALG